MKKNKKLIAIISVTLILIYVGFAIYLLIVHPADTYIIKQGTLSEEDIATGYIIRDEVVIKEENYKNGIYAIVAEGEKVAKQDSIFRYYSDSEKEISNKITELNYKIQELIEKEKNLPSADIKAIENQLEDQIKNIRTLNNSQEIIEYKNSIDNLISKKINFIGEVTENKEVKQLVKERRKYEQQLKNGSEYKKAEISGVVSYRVDGLEGELSKSNFDKLTEEYLDKLDLKTGQIIATSNDCRKSN